MRRRGSLRRPVRSALAVPRRVRGLARVLLARSSFPLPYRPRSSCAATCGRQWVEALPGRRKPECKKCVGLGSPGLRRRRRWRMSRRRKRWPQADVENAQALYDGRLGFAQLGQRLGYSATWLARVLKTAGIPVRPSGRAFTSPGPQVDLDELRYLREQGWSYQKIRRSLWHLG